MLQFEGAVDGLFRSMDCEALRFERAVRTLVSGALCALCALCAVCAVCCVLSVLAVSKCVRNIRTCVRAEEET